MKRSLVWNFYTLFWKGLTLRHTIRIWSDCADNRSQLASWTIYIRLTEFNIIRSIFSLVCITHFICINYNKNCGNAIEDVKCNIFALKPKTQTPQLCISVSKSGWGLRLRVSSKREKAICLDTILPCVEGLCGIQLGKTAP